MTRFPLGSLLLATLASAACATTAQPVAPAYGDSKPEVGAQLLADVKTVKPGEPFRVGVLVTPPAGWHVYWKSSGESGTPTEVAFSGVNCEPLQYPLPERIDAGGGVKVNVYEKATLLFATAKADAATVTTAVVIRAHVTYLVCDADECVPGSKDVELTIPAGAQAQPGDTKLFDEWQARVPKTPAAPELVSFESKGQLAMDSVTHDFETVVTFNAPVANVELFLAPEDSLFLTAPKISVQDRTLKLQLQVAVTGKQVEHDSLEAVVCLDLGGKRRSFSLQIPLRLSSPKR